MGAGYTKILTFLDVGPEGKETQLKNKYSKILTSGIIPKNPSLTWKTLPLDANNAGKTANVLKEGAQFIHGARVKKENILVCISPSDPDSIIFATAYIMLLSGLPPEKSELAVSNALKESELKLEGKYKKALEILYKQGPPKTIRDQLFQPTGSYSVPLLIEDANQIYSLAGLPKPSLGQVLLETDPLQSQTVVTPSATIERTNGQYGGVEMGHAPMTLAETEHRVPVGPAAYSARQERRDHVDLAETQGAHIDGSLLKQGISQPLNDRDYANKQQFSDYSATTPEGFVPSITEWNSVRGVDAEPMKPTLVASVKSQPVKVINEPEELKPALVTLMSSSKSMAAAPPVSAGARVSDDTLGILSDLKSSTNANRYDANRINKPTDSVATINHTKNVKIVRLKPDNIEQKIRLIDESVAKNDENHQTKRTTIKIIRQIPKVNS